ncbi:hypothetical protein Tco_1192974 [Tanacetum coccineum]
MVGECWKTSWGDVPVVPSDGRKKGWVSGLNSNFIYRLKIGYGVTDAFGYAVTMMWQVYGITDVFGYGVTQKVMA